MARPGWSERTENEPCAWGRSPVGEPPSDPGEVLVVPVVAVVVVDSPLFAFDVVKIVIARSGIVLSPVFSTDRVRLVFWARSCLLGNPALTMRTGKSPDGSVTSWR